MVLHGTLMVHVQKPTYYYNTSKTWYYYCKNIKAVKIMHYFKTTVLKYKNNKALLWHIKNMVLPL